MPENVTCTCGKKSDYILTQEAKTWYCHKCERYGFECPKCNQNSMFDLKLTSNHHTRVECVREDCDKLAEAPEPDELAVMANEARDAAEKTESLEGDVFPATCAECRHMGLKLAYEGGDFYVCPNCRLMCSFPKEETAEMHRQRADEYDELKRQKEDSKVMTEGDQEGGFNPPDFLFFKTEWGLNYIDESWEKKDDDGEG